MKFYSLDEAPTQSDDSVFRISPRGRSVPFFTFLGIGIFFLVLGRAGGLRQHGWHLDPALCIYMGVIILVLFGWLSFRGFQASLKPTNWLLRCNDNGILIKYRSFLNWRFPSDDVQVVGFDYTEIASAQAIKEQRISPSTDGHGGPTKQTQRFLYLDFCLANADTSALEERLQAEQKAEPPGWSKTIYRDYPVQVLPGGIVQLRWNGISPSLDKAIEYLGQHLSIAAPVSTKLDLTRDRKLSPEEEKAKIIQLARSGDKMGAVTLVRQIYGYNLREAVAFVEKLQ